MRRKDLSQGTGETLNRNNRNIVGRGGVCVLWLLAVIAACFAMLMYFRITRRYPIGGDDQLNNLYAYYDVTHSSFWATVLAGLKGIWNALRLREVRFFPWGSVPKWLGAQATVDLPTYRTYIALVTILTALAFALLLYRVIGSRHFAMACFCLAPLMMNLLGDTGRNGLYSYAALPQRTFLFFLLGAHAEVSWARKRRWYWALLAGVFMFISCGTYEIGYMYGIVGGFLALMLHDRFKDSVLTYIPQVCGETVSFIFYVLTARLHGSNGSTMTNFDISAIISTWVRQMSGGFPLNSTLMAGVKATSISLDDIIWPLFLAAAAVICLCSGKIKLTKRQTLCLLGGGAVMLGGPAFLISLTSKYQSPVWVSWTYAWISAVVESFGVCVFFLLLLMVLVWLVRRYIRSKAGRSVLYVLLCLSIAMGNAWMHSIVRTSVPVDEVAGYELYGKALENGLADAVGADDRIVSTYTIWGGNSAAERGMYLRHAGKNVDAQTTGTWRAEGSNMPAGTLYLSGLCPGYDMRGAFFLAQVQDQALEHIGRTTLFVDGETVPDEAYVTYRRELADSVEDIRSPLSSLSRTEENDDGCYFAYITDTDILANSLMLRTPEEMTDGRNDAAAGSQQATEAEKDQLLDERIVWRASDTMVEEHDLAVGNVEYGQLVSFPFTIEEDTVYKVEITLGQDTDFDDADQAYLIVDLYAGPEYDRGEQQVGGFIRDGRYDYTFYVDSGDVGGETLEGSVRLFTVGIPETPIPVDALRVTEMDCGG